MKPAPLKGKVKELFGQRFAEDKDIYSAAEWLKKDLYESFEIAQVIQDNITDKHLRNTKELIDKAIDKAFEDVMAVKEAHNDKEAG